MHTKINQMKKILNIFKIENIVKKKQSTNNTKHQSTTSSPPFSLPQPSSNRRRHQSHHASDLNTFSESQRRRHQCGHNNIIKGNHSIVLGNAPLTNTTKHCRPLPRRSDNKSRSFSYIRKPQTAPLSRIFLKKETSFSNLQGKKTQTQTHQNNQRATSPLTPTKIILHFSFFS